MRSSTPSFGNDENGKRLALLPGISQHIEARHSGQADIQQHQRMLRPAGAKYCVPVDAGPDPIHSHALVFQAANQVAADHGVILDQQNTHLPLSPIPERGTLRSL
jgi:hypothetical protein